MSAIIFAIDTGGSKTRMALADERGNILNEADALGFGLAADDELAPLDGLTTAIEGWLSTNERERVECAVANLGGRNARQLERALKRAFVNARVFVYRESSGALAGDIARKNGAHAALLCGTGAICVCFGPKGECICDGWGADIGDMGSGYWIGLTAIRRSLSALEQARPLSMLAKRVTGLSAPIEAGDADAIMRMRDNARLSILPLSRAKAAGYCKTAADCARAGDYMAAQIFEEAGGLLADTVMRAMRLSGLAGGRVMALGGLTKCADLWRDAFNRRAGYDVELLFGDADLTRAALGMALQKIHQHTGE